VTDHDPSDELRRIREAISKIGWVREVVVRLETGSTNDVARELAARGAPQGTIVVADRQWAGRGRLGRSWHSPSGKGLYVSALFRPQAPAAIAGRWTIAAAVAACEACREVSGAPVVIKWPNDLLWCGLKLGGTLVEVRTLGGTPLELVVGTGINVRQRPSEFPPDLRGRAGSLVMASGRRDVDRAALAEAYLDKLGGWASLLDRGAWEEVAARWKALAPGAEGARVRIFGQEEGRGPIEGTTRGLDDTGALQVERDDGSRLTVHLGESVVPVETTPCSSP